MKRDLVRAFRRQGFKPLLIPAAALTLFLIVLFQYLDEYVQHREEAQELDARIQSMETTLEFAKPIEAHQAVLRSEYAAIQSRAYRFEKSVEALDAMKSNVTELLQSLYFEGIKVSAIKPTSIGLANQLDVGAHFTGVPQQLPRLESLLIGYPKALRVSDLSIKVVDETKDAGAYLDVTARFSGVELVPDAPDSPKNLPLPPVK